MHISMTIIYTFSQVGILPFCLLPTFPQNPHSKNRLYFNQYVKTVTFFHFFQTVFPVQPTSALQIDFNKVSLCGI